MKYLKTYLEFLTLLSSSDNPKTYGDVMTKLSINKSQFERLAKHMQKYYENVGHKKGKEHNWDFHLIEINHEGILYLQRLEQSKREKNDIERSNSLNILNVFSNKLIKILKGEDKFFTEFPYFKAPVIILTATILVLVYIGVIFILTKSLSYLISFLNIDYPNYVSIVIIILVIIIATIMYIKNNQEEKK